MNPANGTKLSSTRATPRTHIGTTTLSVENAGDQKAPNGVDLRVGRVFKILTDSVVVLSERVKEHANKEEIFPTEIIGPQSTSGKELAWKLTRGTYEVLFEETISIDKNENGEDEAGWVITRSTLNRNGIFITSGLYDSGYHGVMAGALHVTGPTLYLVPGTRIAQYVSSLAEAAKQYSLDGSYGFNSVHDATAYEQKAVK